MKKIRIIGGGTVFHVRPHLAITAVAYGGTAKMIARECTLVFSNQQYEIITHLTSMASAGQSNIETNADVKKLLDEICKDITTKIVFLPVALCDFEGYIVENNELSESGKNQLRLKSRAGNYQMHLLKADKLISSIKQKRQDIQLIGFKTSAGVSENETITMAGKLLNDARCDFVFANDIQRRINLIVGKNEYVSDIFRDRKLSINHLVKIVFENNE